jgi:hypothetical protein
MEDGNDWKISLELATQEVVKNVARGVGDHAVVVVMAGVPAGNKWYAAWHGSCLEVRGLLAQCEETLKSPGSELAEFSTLACLLAKDLAHALGEGAAAIILAGRNVGLHSCHYAAWEGPPLTVRGLFEVGKEAVVRAVHGMKDVRPGAPAGIEGTPA